MNNIAPLDGRYIQVRRVVASIAYQNQEIDEQERLILASSVAGQYQLSEEQIHILVEDAVKSPCIEDLVRQICDPQFIRLLLMDLMTLAIFKKEWEESEYGAAIRAINALILQKHLTAEIRQAFDLLVTATSHFDTN